MCNNTLPRPFSRICGTAEQLYFVVFISFHSGIKLDSYAIFLKKRKIIAQGLRTKYPYKTT